MNLGSSTDDIAYLLVGGIASIFVIPLLLGISSLIVRLSSRILGISTGWPMFIVLVLLSGMAVMAGSLYLDTAGVKTTGIVIEKTEFVEIREQGDWQHRFEALVEYPYSGETGSVRLRVNEGRFDALAEGEPAELELLPLYRTISLVRLAVIDTAAWLLPVMRWVGVGLFVVLSVWLLIRTKSNLAYIVVGVLGVAAAILIPLTRTYQAGQAADDLGSRPLRARATITDMQRITNIDYFPCEGNCSDSGDSSFDVPQQYDIVQLRYRPEESRTEVLAVDSADVDTVTMELGGTVEIAYTAEAPRDVQIIGATHTHHWRNATYYVWRYVAIWLVFIVAWFGVSRWLQNMGWLQRPVVDEY